VAARSLGDHLIVRGIVVAEVLAVRLGDGRRCTGNLPHTDDLDLDIDRRLELGDVAAVYDAIVEAVGELEDIAEQYGDAIGDPESLERVRRIRARCRAIPCTRED
jgi:hypothetical protein